MRTVKMTLEEALVEEVDAISRQLHTTRSEFAREALREALTRHKTAQLENKHQQAYARHPVTAGEFSVWEDQQAWVEG